VRCGEEEREERRPAVGDHVEEVLGPHVLLAVELVQGGCPPSCETEVKMGGGGGDGEVPGVDTARSKADSMRLI
jgi:hypothetical protein